ncbi:hypothetical protein [Frigidibacter oleivorans]|uniref:hypothetical protein n=1 Tax=Frigidibacter oleivorans TaxID=2487129 RepID=UPI000F8DE71B|nr:hypothetical protein [Frigidibacter oleivorans]
MARTGARDLARALCLAAALCALPGIGQAGPWARDKGGAFLSLSQEGGGAGTGWTSVYAEYGLTPRLTLGLDAGRGSSGDDQLHLFLQQAILTGPGPNRLSLTMGAGLERRVDPASPDIAFGSLGLAWGRSLGTPLGPGWVAVEPQLRLGVEVTKDWPPTVLLTPDLKMTTALTGRLDLTLGLHVTARTMLIGQLRLDRGFETGQGAAAGTTTPVAGSGGSVSATAVRRIAGPAHLSLGLAAPLGEGGETALRLGSWLQF